MLVLYKTNNNRAIVKVFSFRENTKKFLPLTHKYSSFIHTIHSIHDSLTYPS